MKRCWESDASKRPQFAEIVEELEAVFHCFQSSKSSSTAVFEAASEFTDDLIFSERDLLQFSATAASVHIGVNATPQTRLPKSGDNDSESDKVLGAANPRSCSGSHESKSSPEAESGGQSEAIAISASQLSPTNVVCVQYCLFIFTL